MYIKAIIYQVPNVNLFHNFITIDTCLLKKVGQTFKALNTWAAVKCLKALLVIFYFNARLENKLARISTLNILCRFNFT